MPPSSSLQAAFPPSSRLTRRTLCTANSGPLVVPVSGTFQWSRCRRGSGPAQLTPSGREEHRSHPFSNSQRFASELETDIPSWHRDGEQLRLAESPRRVTSCAPVSCSTSRLYLVTTHSTGRWQQNAGYGVHSHIPVHANRRRTQVLQGFPPTASKPHRPSTGDNQCGISRYHSPETIAGSIDRVCILLELVLNPASDKHSHGSATRRGPRLR